MGHPVGTFEGEFWQVETPDRRVAGTLTIADEDRALSLSTTQSIFTEQRYKVMDGGRVIAFSGDPEDLVADFKPRTIHGVLADGTDVSVIDAQGGNRRQMSLRTSPLEAGQDFSARHVIVGGIATADEPFHAIRFRVLGPPWYGEPDDQSVTQDGGQLRLLFDDEGNRWFEFTSAKPAPLGAFDMRVIHPVTTLAELATNGDAVDDEIYVRRNSTSPWLPAVRERDPVSLGRHPLLPTNSITAQHFTAWIDCRTETDGLDAAAIDELKGVAIQTQVLAQVAVAEGLHRRLFGDSKRRVPGLSNGKIKAMRHAFRDAAMRLMPEPAFTDADRSEFGTAVREAFAHINDQPFRSRMADLLADARASIPSLGSDFHDWVSVVTMARNLLAHQPGLKDRVETEEFLDLLIALSYSIEWVLRTNLLNRAGFDAQLMRDGYRDSSAYGHHLANVRNLLAGGPYAAVP